MGECQRCQTIKVNITKKLLDLEITFSQWETREQLVRKRGKMVKKNIFSLFSRTTTVGEARDLLVERLPKLRKHIYVAHQLWNAYATLRENLDESSVIAIEDYHLQNNQPQVATQQIKLLLHFILYVLNIEEMMQR